MKLLKKVDYYWYTINFFFWFLFFGFCYFLYFLININRPKNNLKTTIGTVVKYDRGLRGSVSSEFVFFYKGKSYSSSSDPDFVLGEKFLIKFDSLSPIKNEVCTDKPLFLKNESYKITTGCLDKLSTGLFKTMIFSYKVNNKNYTQFYSPPTDVKLKFPNFKEGSKYKVRYWIINPERSIIFPNQPVRTVMTQRESQRKR